MPAASFSFFPVRRKGLRPLSFSLPDGFAARLLALNGLQGRDLHCLVGRVIAGAKADENGEHHGEQQQPRRDHRHPAYVLSSQHRSRQVLQGKATQGHQVDDHRRNKADYAAELNSFLKVYMLNCAKNGCILLATAKDESKIESPFLINNKRFGVIVNLENED